MKERTLRPDEGTRIDRGEDPVGARRAALEEFGYETAVRDEMRRVTSWDVTRCSAGS
jgi:hypothetical protein